MVRTFGGSAFSWSSRTQVSVMLRSSEAEYDALTDCAKDIFNLKMLLVFLRPNMRVKVSKDGENFNELT